MSKHDDGDPFDHAERPEIIEDDEDLFGDREGPCGPYRIPDDADQEPGRPIRDRQDEVDLSDDKYGVDSANETMMITHVKSLHATYHNGGHITSSHCAAERGCLIDPDYFEPTGKYESEAVTRSAGSDKFSDRSTQADRLDQ